MTTIEIQNGLDEFNLIGEKDCTIFQYRNRSKILVWEMNWNSLMNYFIGSIPSRPIFYFEAFGILENKLKVGGINDKNLEGLIKPMLNSFGNGTYNVEIINEYEQFDIVKPGISNLIRNGEEEKMIGWWAGGYPPFLYAIQETTDQVTIDEYKTQIKSGTKPQIILIKAKDSCIHFILDGHHKFIAYTELGIKPNCILINKIDNYKVDYDIIRRTFEKLKTNRSEHLIQQLESHLKELSTDTNTAYNDQSG